MMKQSFESTKYHQAGKWFDPRSCVKYNRPDIDIDWRLTDSEDDFRPGCPNVSQCLACVASVSLGKHARFLMFWPREKWGESLVQNLLLRLVNVIPNSPSHEYTQPDRKLLSLAEKAFSVEKYQRQPICEQIHAFPSLLLSLGNLCNTKMRNIDAQMILFRILAKIYLGKEKYLSLSAIKVGHRGSPRVLG